MSLNIIYTAVATSIVFLFALVRKGRLGLAGIWGVYVWFQAARIFLFLSFSGLLGTFFQSSDEPLLSEVIESKGNYRGS